MSWEDVGSVADLERDGHVVARIGGREVGVVAVNGKLRGIRNRCPHHGAPLCLGDVVDRLEAPAPGRYATSGQAVLRCPWHGWEFELERGICLDEPSLRVAVYPARVENGRVLVRA